MNGFWDGVKYFFAEDKGVLRNVVYAIGALFVVIGGIAAFLSSSKKGKRKKLRQP